MALAFSAEGQDGGAIVSDARTGKRFPLELPIKIHKEDSAGEASGITGNLSAAGVYIRADAALDIGSPVEFQITLPPTSPAARRTSSFNVTGAWFGRMSPIPGTPKILAAWLA